MKRTVLLLLLLLLGAARWLPGQITLEVLLEQENYLRDFSLPAKVRISNSSGQTIRFGQEPDWLSFEIRDARGLDVRQVGKVELADAFLLPSAKVANLTTDLMPYFDLGKSGRYSLIVHLKVAELNRTLSSPAKPFNIVNGNTVWQHEFGLPGVAKVEARKYALQQVSLGKELRLYMRLTDPGEHRVFRVLPLGTLLSVSKPECLVDRSCQLHILYQSGARSFLYQIVSPDGDIIIRQTHEYVGSSRPVLRHTEEQAVVVAGGARRPQATDLPPPQPDPLTPLLPLEPPRTNQPPAKPPPARSPAQPAK
jgi:hypothetical protein